MSCSRDDGKFREYLLGQLTGEDREEFERLLFTDDDLLERLQTAEGDLIDDYLTGDLNQDEAALFQKNFLVGSKRERELRIGKAWRNYAAAHREEKLPAPAGGPVLNLSPSPVSGPFMIWRQFTSSFGLKFAALVGLAFIVVLAYLWLRPSEVDKGLKALDAAFRHERPLQSRITQLSYAPFVSNRGSGSGSVDEGELSQAELSLRTIVNNKPTPAAHHALGNVYLAKKEFDKAIEQFEEALKGEPKNAQVHADLGAALFEKGKLEIEKAKTDSDSAESGKGVTYFARSLESLNTALKLDNSRLEALFNRALLYESMGLLQDAENDWRQYLDRDPNSKWAGDARTRLADVEKRRKQTSLTHEEIFKIYLKQLESGDENGVATTVSSYQNRTGNVVVEQLIDRYLEASTQNQKEAANEALRQLTYVGDLQVRKHGDRYFSDLAHFYRISDSEQRDSVIKAREFMKSGYDRWGKIGHDEERNLFENARELFERARDHPEARVAEYWISFCYYNDRNQRQASHEQTLQTLKPVFVAGKDLSYLWLLSRALYLQSSIEFDLNKQSQAVDYGLQSADIAERTNDLVGLLNAEICLINSYRYLGSYSKALGYIQRSLLLATAITLDPVQRSRHYSHVALTFTKIGLYDAAAEYQREALHVAPETDSLIVKSQNQAFMATINGKLKNLDEAVKDAQLAFDLAQHQDQPDDSRMGYSALQLGDIYRESGDCDKAVVEYTRSIDIYGSFKPQLFQAHKGRFLCYIRQQNDLLAQQEISILLEFLTKYRSAITDENCRNTFFDVEQNVFDAAIDFQYSRMNNREQAFTYLNSSRARSLEDMLNADKEVTERVQDPDIKFKTFTEPRPLEVIRNQLPEQTQLLQYVILEDKLLIFFISKNNFQVRMQPIPKQELNEKLLRFLNIISRSPKDDETQELQLGKDLYSILIQPVADLLDKDKLLCIIPDGTLSYLPFAALVSPESSKYLIEERLLMTSPSPSVFLSCSENALRTSEPRVERILSVGNPTFDRSAFASFEDLPEAAKEAQEVRAKYQLGVSLTGEGATRIAVKSEIERSDVIQLALHSQIDEEFPLRSKLLLAKTKNKAPKPDEISDSVVFAYEIYNLKLSRARLVVLASCDSGAGRYYDGEGVSSLARAFIGAGVPLVVASLWPVESAATEKLMVSFHSHRTQDPTTTVEALRSAQNDLLHGPDTYLRRPYYWAAFNVTGGYATF